MFREHLRIVEESSRVFRIPANYTVKMPSPALARATSKAGTAQVDADQQVVEPRRPAKRVSVSLAATSMLWQALQRCSRPIRKALLLKCHNSHVCAQMLCLYLTALRIRLASSRPLFSLFQLSMFKSPAIHTWIGIYLTLSSGISHLW